MVAAGYHSIGGVEYHALAANIYDLNHQIKVTRSNILNIDRIPTVDLLWASPPCPAFSIANTRRGETNKDIDLAKHISKLMIDSRPKSIAIENVRGYQHSKSLKIILDRLRSNGYTIDINMYNAANYGVPSTRERLIVRATLGNLSPVVRTHQKPSHQIGLFDLPNWASWWEVVKDRIYELPASQLTKNQLRSIENSARSKILIERVGYYGGNPSIYAEDIPAPTIRSAPHCDDKGSYRVAANILDGYECYAADIKCLAAWQSFPPEYRWSENRGQAGRAIGNAVPCRLAQKIAESFGD